MKIGLLALALLLLAGNLSAWEDTVNTRRQREKMVRTQIENRGIHDRRILRAMGTVPRHLFVPERDLSAAYEDHPLPIGEGQTISQPYVVALMTEALNLKPEYRVLEIGTGSGYQAAVLAELVSQVYTIEIKKALHARASKVLADLDYANIHTRHGDGYHGWPDKPFDCIMITAAVDHIPPPLLRQLKDGGRMVLPLGDPFAFQNLVLVTKQDQTYRVKTITGVLFVPMTGTAMEQ